MAQYVVDFEWTEPPPADELPRRILKAATDNDAKLEAALLFAVGDFRGASPCGYRVLELARGEILRYPAD
ncbi:MAG: hypothetical protein ACREE0_15775 [Phenylobacterium sp.]